MSEKMTVLVVKHTQNVVGAITHNGISEQTADRLAPNGLRVRDFVKQTGAVGDEEFTISLDELEAKLVDVKSAVFIQPRKYIVANDEATAPAGKTTDAQLTATEVEVKVDANVTKDAKVWIQIEGGALSTPSLATGILASGGNTAVVPIDTLSPGSYFVLALVEGHSLYGGTDSVL